MTPLHLKLLLHAYTCPDAYEPASPTSNNYQIELMEAGLIFMGPNDTSFNCTDKGKAHIKQMIRLPLPTQAWISANGERLDIPT